MLLGQKIAMTQTFRDDGTVEPCTVVAAGPCVVTQVKTPTKDGYGAVQIGFGKAKHQTKARSGHLKDLPALKILKEFRVPSVEGFTRGQTLDVTQFQANDVVRVTGWSKGRGFQGVVKRHHFKGGPASHGHKDNLRMPGSIGATFPQHVVKGTRMAGRMAVHRVTQRHLRVLAVEPERHQLTISGALPGARRGLILIEEQ